MLSKFKITTRFTFVVAAMVVSMIALGVCLDRLAKDLGDQPVGAATPAAA